MRQEHTPVTATDVRKSKRQPRAHAWTRVALPIGLGLCAVSTLLSALVWRLINQADGRIVSGGRTRSYLLYVPDSYDPATPAPLVISIHGFAEWPAHQRQISRWNDLADRHGFIVVYPAGTGFPRRWRTSGHGQTPAEAMQDVTFIADLIDALAGRYNVDRTRIYANGLSNGGGMSYLLACRLADRIAAVGSVAGAYLCPVEACRPRRPVPFIAFHGTADPIVPYHGGPSAFFHLPFPAVPGWIAAWASRSGCDATPVPLPGRGEVSGLQYTGCQGGADVVFYTIEGGGHAWPGSDPMPRFIVGHTTQDIDATAVMWEFFSRHTLPMSSGAP
jgi:polyhydroxybutyrate depolymerase